MIDRNNSGLYKYIPSGKGLLFTLSSQIKEKNKSKNTLICYQKVLLNSLVECGNARKLEDGAIHVPNEICCSLKIQDREILDLPSSWPGEFELKCKRHTFDADFEIILFLKQNGKRIKEYTFESDIFLHINDKVYIPDYAQWKVLKTISDHRNIPSGQHSEYDNLFTILRLKEAQKEGCCIDLRHFQKLSPISPTDIGITVIENEDGSLELNPYFGENINPEEVRERLGQLYSKNKEGTSFRVNNNIIILDDQKIKAIDEILNNKTIPKRDKKQFLLTPSAFLDTSLINLDIGFSLRVHGVTEFKQAYFGLDSDQTRDWFGEAIPEKSINKVLPDIKNQDDLKSFIESVQNAHKNGQKNVIWKGKDIPIPSNQEEFENMLQILHTKFVNKSYIFKEQQSSENNSEQLVVDISLNDENIYISNKNYNTKNIYTKYLDEANLKHGFYPYQEQGVRWLIGRMQQISEQNQGNIDIQKGNGALLADDMGLGKTFMTLVALQIFLEKMKVQNTEKPILAVMPVVLLENWKIEIEKTFKIHPFKDIIILHRDGDLAKFKGKGKAIIDNHEISQWLKIGNKYLTERLDIPRRLVLTNYDVLRDFQFSLCQVDWGVVIFDEAQAIKNPNALVTRAAKGLKADFMLAITGTPVENSLSDIWCLIDTVCPGHLNTYQNFRKKYITPLKDITDIDIDKKRSELGLLLRKDIGNIMIRRTKEEELDGLPRKFIHSGNIDIRYRGVMDGQQLKKYNEIINSVVQAKTNNDGSIKKILLPSLHKLSLVSIHSIFAEEQINFNNLDIKNIFSQSIKLSLLLSILNEIKERNEKVIIFVISRSIQKFLSVSLQKIYSLENIHIINGLTKSIHTDKNKDISNQVVQTRLGLINDFEKYDGFNIIIMSPLAAGVGFTVTNANNVIHLERHWNPAKEAQATDRVYRIGQNRDVHVYYPIADHPTKVSFDRNLEDLLSHKMTISNSVMVVNGLTLKDFNTNEIFGTNDILSPEEEYDDIVNHTKI